jgi:hypothetical protein
MKLTGVTPSLSETFCVHLRVIQPLEEEITWQLRPRRDSNMKMDFTEVPLNVFP